MVNVNSLKGEYALIVGDETYKLCLDVNQLCVAEGTLGASSAEIIPKVTAGDMRALRAVMHAALGRFHPDIDLFGAGEILTELTPVKAQAELVACLRLSFPSQEAPAGGGEPRPTKPARGERTA